MVMSGAERGEFGIDWRLPGLKDGPELGARLIELAERATLAHRARADAGEDMSGLGTGGARIAPPRPSPAGVRWSGAAGDRA
jgi:hypothetical protein